MLQKAAIVCLSVLALSVTGLAQNAASDSAMSLLSGKSAPLTIHLKELDSNWRVFNASSSSYENLIASAMMGGKGNPVFTKGDTVSIGTDVFLIAYKPETPNMASLFSGGGGPPKPKPLTEDTVLRLSLINLHALSEMDGIRVFDLKEQIASSKTPTLLDIFQGRGSTSDSTTTEAKIKQPSEPALLKNGSQAPDFTVRDDNGRAIRLSSYRGKVVVVDFWATWCGPCQESLPGTNSIAKRYKGRNVAFLGVNVWDQKKAFHDWLPGHKSLNAIKFAIDTHGQGEDVATKLYHVSGIPTQYVIDRKGRIVKSIVGYDENESPLSSAIKEALSRR